MSGDLVPTSPRLPDDPGGEDVVEVLDIVERRTWQQLVGEGVAALPNLLKMVYRLMTDRRVPVRRKVMVGVILGYLASPFDIVPDFIPVLGQVDDVLLVALAVSKLVDAVGREVALEYWDGSEDAFDIVDALLEWGADLVPAPLRKFLER